MNCIQMAAPKGDVMRGDGLPAGSDLSFEQIVHQLPSGHLPIHQMSNQHIHQIQNLTQKQVVTVVAQHPSNSSLSAIQNHNRMQQQPTRQLLHHFNHQQQNRISHLCGNSNDLVFNTAVGNGPAAADSGRKSGATDASDSNKVVVNIASTNLSTQNASAKTSMMSLTNNNVISSNSSNKIITNVTQIPSENIRVLQQQQNQSNVKTAETDKTDLMTKFNIAPGWRRIKYNYEIIYISPTGAPLRNFSQVKEYLLSTGTCKCGLPCPFQLEAFFEFDSQVPDALLDSNESHNFCLHHSKYVDKTESVPCAKKATEMINVSKSDSIQPVGNTTFVQAQLSTMAPHKFFRTGESTHAPNVLINNELTLHPQPQHIVIDKEVTTIPLSRTPPWRKHASTLSRTSLSATPSSVKTSTPLQHSNVINQRQNPHASTNSMQAKFPAQSANQTEQIIRTCRMPNNDEDFSIPLECSKQICATKKRPNFKDDPTGYLNQQTAMLHSSISTLHSPDGSSSSQEGIHLKALSNYDSGESACTESSNLNRIHVERISNDTPNKPLIVNPDVRTIEDSQNEMVQVQQNCDISHMKLQQQLQFQQQLKRQNQLVRQHNEQLQQLHIQQHQCEDALKTSTRRFTEGVVLESPVLSSTTAFIASQTSDVSSTSSSTLSMRNPIQGGAISTSNRGQAFQNNIAVIRSESPETSKNKNLMHSSIERVEYSKQQGISNKYVALTGNSVIPRSVETENPTVKSSAIIKTFKDVVNKETEDKESELFTPSNSLAKNERNLMENCATTNNSLNMVNFAQTQFPQHSQMVSQQQVLMTSNGQIIVMSTQPSKNLDGSVGGGSTTQNVVVPQQSIAIGESTTQNVNAVAITEGSNPIGNHTVAKNTGGSDTNCTGMIQSLDQQQHQSNIIHHSQSNSSFLANSPTNMQSAVILNSGNLVQSGGQQILTSNSSHLIHSGNTLATVSPDTKVITSGGGTGIITNQQNISQLMNANNASTAIQVNSGGMMGQPGATVLINSLPSNSIVIQQQSNFSAVADGRQMVNQVFNQDGTTTSFVQQHSQQRHILISPESKRKAKKRKSSGTATLISPGSLPQQSSTQQQPSAISQQALQPVGPSGTVLQLTPQYPAQSFQLTPSISGLTIVPSKSHQPHQQQQQILLQNGQLITQPYNIISQQVLLPTGLVMAPDATTLVQIQNVATPCGSIITPQTMMIRAQSPHQTKGFLSPSTGQQFIVNNNGQVSPIGSHQLYGGPVNIVVPQQQSGPTASHYVQQGTTLLQHSVQHGTSHSNTSSESSLIAREDSPLPNSSLPVQAQRIHRRSSSTVYQFSSTASPPDTTTHSPNSPDCSSSDKSGESADSMNTAMVQCVSSSEPDLVSPIATEMANSPSESSDIVEQSGIPMYQRTTYHRPSETKIRKIQTALQQQSPSSFIIHDDNSRTRSIIDAASNISSSQHIPNAIVQHQQMSQGSSSSTIHGNILPDSHGKYRSGSTIVCWSTSRLI